MEPTRQESASICARTLCTIKDHAVRGQFGCQYQPLFDIEPDHTIPDELHLLLRVMDVLIRYKYVSNVFHLNALVLTINWPFLQLYIILRTMYSLHTT